jgi:hypothetical protein
MLDAYRETLEGLLKRYPEITVIRLREELQALGYQGGYSVLRERVKTLRATTVVEPVQRFETGPGLHYGKPGVMCGSARWRACLR